MIRPYLHQEHHRVLGDLPERFDTHLAMMDGALVMHLKKQQSP